jgi:hypothetical protein
MKMSKLAFHESRAINTLDVSFFGGITHVSFLDSTIKAYLALFA